MPPIRPPMWPPTEIPLTVNENGLKVDHDQREGLAGDVAGLLVTSMMSNAPKIPKTAPDAPTVMPVGVAISAPAAPASPRRGTAPDSGRAR